MEQILQEFDFVLEYAKFTEENYDYKKMEYLEIMEKEFKEKQLLEEIGYEF